ncbi:hypothetical protein [Paludisphaera mucosa]|uniref:DUF3150 domain-containing protein n=1 Tax=Paludisphaera mucosa TaxID=3030827 RepID=A0ABT6FD03_9BACT|nr:hypothetical protein [Paludisphaera mucosa]MDG3005460.1 hypothetical protein [Paludisphaera mucosa]
MTTLLDRIDGPPAGPPDDLADPARRLRDETAAARVSFTWLGTRKALTAPQRDRAAEAFDAEGSCLSAGKRLLDVGHPAFRAVTAVRGRIRSYWRETSLPFPEPGVRLIRKNQVDDFARRIVDFQAELDDAVAELDRRYGELRRAAAERLGSLYDPADYPSTLVGLFAVSCDFPSVEPPEYLSRLSPALFERERARMESRFEEAVELAERAFAEEFASLVERLAERLDGVGDDGRPKVFRDSAVENLCGFFDRFKALNVRGDAQLDELVERAREAVRGVAARDLREGPDLRARVARQLSQVQSALDGMLVDRPRRRILRQAAATGGA